MFIYVMDAESAAYLQERGFRLIKERNGTWCFDAESRDVMTFEIMCPHVVSDVMVF